MAFDGKRTFTTGKGTVQFTHRSLTEPLPSFSITLEDAEELPGMSHPLISLGTLFSLGWTFDFGISEPGKAYAFPPCDDTEIPPRTDLRSHYTLQKILLSVLGKMFP